VEIQHASPDPAATGDNSCVKLAGKSNNGGRDVELHSPGRRLWGRFGCHKEPPLLESNDSGDELDSDEENTRHHVYARPPTVSEALNALKNLEAATWTRKPAGRYVYKKLD
jgi:hypothetical protein